MVQPPTPADVARAQRRRSRLAPSALFFPAAALYGAVILPWSVLAMAGVVAGPASLSAPFGHAHEMLLGYALAVVAGHQIPPMPPQRAWMLLVLWAAARLAFVAVSGAAALVLDAAFALALAVHVAPRLFRAAKKLRNQALPVVLSALCAAAVGYDVAMMLAGAVALRATVTMIVLLLAALMLFMGGRIIAPAAAGEFYRQGRSLAARVQPRIEGALLVLMAIAVASAAAPRFDVAVRIACAGAGALALVRLARWRLWSCSARPDLLSLGAGYAWLAAGLLAIAMSASGNARVAALHVVTIGALGTLTVAVMARTMLLRSGRVPTDARTLLWATALIGCATALRVVAAFAGAPATSLLIAAAACWSCALTALFVLLLRCRAPSDGALASDRRGATTE